MKKNYNAAIREGMIRASCLLPRISDISDFLIEAHLPSSGNKRVYIFADVVTKSDYKNIVTSEVFDAIEKCRYLINTDYPWGCFAATREKIRFLLMMYRKDLFLLLEQFSFLPICFDAERRMGNYDGQLVLTAGFTQFGIADADEVDAEFNRCRKDRDIDENEIITYCNNYGFEFCEMFDHNIISWEGNDFLDIFGIDTFAEILMVLVERERYREKLELEKLQRRIEYHNYDYGYDLGVYNH